MTALKKRRLISTVLDFSVMFLLWIVGAGAWSLVVAPLSVWAFYDGQTRCDLMSPNA